MRPNSIRRLLDDDAPTLGTHLLLASPTVIDLVGHTGVFDYVEFLAEYARTICPSSRISAVRPSSTASAR